MENSPPTPRLRRIKKIGIDATFFGPKDRGIGRYTENLIRNLEKIDPPVGGNQYFIFLKKERDLDYQPQNPNFKKILISRNLRPGKIKQYNIDLMHFTYYRVPIFYSGRFILTVHDLTWQRFPIFNPLKRWIYKIIFNLAIQRAKKIIAVSEYTKKDIIENYKINPVKIEVIYEGVN